ncbi:MAG: glycosyltransferase family 2 protein [Deltaproteobacteria bacterium]|nr:glycosyltransferase family 2 protein [Deltaproteobacteria bacterium]
MPERMAVYVHIVTYNSGGYIRHALEALLRLESFTLGENLVVDVTDNASCDDSYENAREYSPRGVTVYRNSSNLGFCGAHNQGLRRFLDSNCDFYLCLNPDVALRPDALTELCSAFEKSGVGSACPKLVRADELLQPLEPSVIDAAGMIITPSLRHFDRGAGESDTGQYSAECAVFGGSGACLIMSREFVESLIVEGKFESDIDALYPALAAGRSKRALLFDEAFFAYREDADLAWRAQYLGWKCAFVPSACGYHVRFVTPERRKILPATINSLGVRNRFLLQLNNYSLLLGAAPFFIGYLFRNCVVIAGVILRERSSIGGLLELRYLLRRAFERRKLIMRRRKASPQEVGRWFRSAGHIEELK